MKWRWRGKLYHSWQERNMAIKGVFDRTRYVFTDRASRTDRDELVARQLDGAELRFTIERCGDVAVIAPFPNRLPVESTLQAAES